MGSLSNFVKRVRDIMRNDAGINGDAQRIEQIAWMLFLKVYDAKEQDWEWDDEEYVSIIPEECRWQNWAVDDHTGTALTGDKLLNFVNNTLFPVLKGNDIKDATGKIIIPGVKVDSSTPIKKAIVQTTFADANQYMKDGVLLRQVINVIDDLDLGDYEESHAFGEIYETILKELQSAGSSGEFYTPRAVTDFMAKMINPQIGEQVADFAAMPADRRNRKTSVSYRTPRSDASQLRRDAIAILLAFFLVGLVYVCSTALTGWFPNIVAAAWYRAETRPLTMIPFGVLPLIVFAAVVLLRAGRLPNVTKIIAIVLLAALAISCQFGNTVRSALSDAVYANMTIDDARPDEQLTATKEKILKKVVKETGTDSVVVSDPLNGSMYATAMYGADMLFPIYNAKAEKNGAIFGQTENAFASGDGKALTNTVCPLSADGDAYFLSMGGQAPSLQMFTFKQQYDTFHDQKLIDQYAKDGTMRKVQDYSNMASYAKGWALYQFNCQ